LLAEHDPSLLLIVWKTILILSEEVLAASFKCFLRRECDESSHWCGECATLHLKQLIYLFLHFLDSVQIGVSEHQPPSGKKLYHFSVLVRKAELGYFDFLVC
jgi:hypothetical protein